MKYTVLVWETVDTENDQPWDSFTFDSSLPDSTASKDGYTLNGYRCGVPWPIPPRGSLMIQDPNSEFNISITYTTPTIRIPEYMIDVIKPAYTNDTVRKQFIELPKTHEIVLFENEKKRIAIDLVLTEAIDPLYHQIVEDDNVISAYYYLYVPHRILITCDESV
jgi:hypothetical protein